MFTKSDLDLLFSMVPINLGESLSDIFSLENCPGRKELTVRFKDAYDGSKTSASMVKIFFENLGMDKKEQFLVKYSPKLERNHMILRTDGFKM